MRKRRAARRGKAPAQGLTNDRKIEGSEPSPASPSPKEISKRSKSIVSKFLIGLSITALLTIAKVGLEQTRFGQQLERMTVNLLQLRLTDAARGRPVRVAVVDISGLLPIPTGVGDDVELITPRKELTEIVGAIARAEPAAIGIDIIFQPDDHGHLPPGDERFLDFCLHLRNNSGEQIPTFVGIYESIARGPKGWLGEERFGPLGASIVVPRSEGGGPTTRIALFIRVKGEDGDIPTPSLSYALGHATVTNETQRRWLGRRLHIYFPEIVESEIVREEKLIESHEVDIDFGTTSDMIAAAVPAKRGADLTGKTAALRGKVVLVGRGAMGKANDQFNVPGQGAPVPGVYVHAAAVNTLLDTPLYRLTNSGRVLADVLAGVIPLGIIFAIEWSQHRRAVSRLAAEHLSRLLAIGMAVAIVIFGYFWIDWSGILWTDFLMVIGALLLHGPAEQVIDQGRKLLELARRPSK